MLPRIAVTVTRPVLVDDRGQLVPDPSQPSVAQVIADCIVQPETAPREDGGDDRLGAIARLVVHAPVGSDIALGDRVTVDGIDYRVDAQPREWPAPIPHVEVHLSAWEA